MIFRSETSVRIKKGLKTTAILYSTYVVLFSVGMVGTSLAGSTTVFLDLSIPFCCLSLTKNRFDTSRQVKTNEKQSLRL